MIKIILCNFRRKKNRIFMTVMGIAIGVMSVIIISSIGDIGKNTINKELESLGLGGIMITTGNNTPGVSLNGEHLGIIRGNNGVDSAMPVIMDFRKTYMRDLMMDSVICGIDFGANNVIALDILHGRLITKNDILNKRKVCIIDKSIAQAYYKRDNIVGKKITLEVAGKTEQLEIVGVVATGGDFTQAVVGASMPALLYMPYTALQEVSGTDHFNSILVTPKTGIDYDILGKQIVTQLQNYTGYNSAFKFENIGAQKEKVNNLIKIITLVLSAIAGVSLLVSGLGIMTIMITSVSERTNEIGIKKSIGASKKMIMLEFLIEALIISFIGSLIGVLGGMLIVLIGCMIFKINFAVNITILVYSLLLSVILGAVFGVYPALSASNLKPVDALRRY